MNDDFDEDGDPITLTVEDKTLTAEEITDIDAALTVCEDAAMRAELTRQRRQLAAELVAGRRLPLLDTDEGQGNG